MKREPQAIERAADFDAGELRTSCTPGPAGEFQDGGDMTEIGDPVVAGGQVDRVADKTAGSSQGEAGETWNGNKDVASALCEVEGGQAIHLALPVDFFTERKVGSVGERLGEGGVPLAHELREQLVAYAVAGEIEGRIGGVFAPGNAAITEEANDLRALDVDQRADHAVGCDGAYGSQPGGARAAQEAKEDGFGLVGACMAERDARRKSASQVVAEKRIPRVAGGLLEIALGGGEIEFVETKREFKRGGERTDELGIGARSVAAQIVIDVHDADRQVPPGGKLEENVEEADGVGAAGDSDSNAIAGIEHAMALDGMDDSVEQDDFIVGLASGAGHKSGAG